MPKRFVYFVSAIALLSLAIAARSASQEQNNQAQPQHPKMSFTPGTVIRAEIEKAVDAKKAQIGDPVLAKTIDDLKTDPPSLATKGCKIYGHVVEVSPHQGDSASTLGIVFDKMVLKDGTDVPLPASIQAIGVPDAGPIGNNSNETAMTNMGGAAGVRQAAPDINSGSGDPTGYAGERIPMPGATHAKLPLYAHGVWGMSGVTLGTGTENDSLLSSKKRNIKIEDGMQIILRTQ